MTYYVRTEMTERVPFWMQNARRKEEPPDMERHNYRKMGPLVEDHPMVRDGTTCPGCNKTFSSGDLVTLVAIGPGGDQEERERCRSGRAFNAVAIPVHWACATGEEG